MASKKLNVPLHVCEGEVLEEEHKAAQQLANVIEMKANRRRHRRNRIHQV